MIVHWTAAVRRPGPFLGGTLTRHARPRFAAASVRVDPFPS
jgi:hypothetical protein